jgi:hypothetical protein
MDGDKERALENIQKLMAPKGPIGITGSTGDNVRGITGTTLGAMMSRQELQEMLALYGNGAISFNSIYERMGVEIKHDDYDPVNLLAKIWGDDSGLKKIV